MTIDGRRKGKKALEEERKGFSERRGDLGRTWGVIGGEPPIPWVSLLDLYINKVYRS